jgi:hypothetical protein
MSFIGQYTRVLGAKSKNINVERSTSQLCHRSSSQADAWSTADELKTRQQLMLCLEEGNNEAEQYAQNAVDVDVRKGWPEQREDLKTRYDRYEPSGE